jgi:Spy/CpxP family protein refolding chaperone
MGLSVGCWGPSLAGIASKVGWVDGLPAMLDRVAAEAAAGGTNLKRIKQMSVVLSGVLFLGVSVSAVAQTPGAPQSQTQAAPQAPPQAPPQMTMDQRMARLTQVLNLTPAQAQQIRPILEQAQSKMQALAADTATPMADRQAKAVTIRDSVRSQIDAILTPEQKQRAMAPPPGAPGAGAPAAQPQPHL